MGRQQAGGLSHMQSSPFHLKKEPGSGSPALFKIVLPQSPLARIENSRIRAPRQERGGGNGRRG
jgi:hypothetical protein